jgi:Domain of Unknown Function with PDB structure (DUF3857)
MKSRQFSLEAAPMRKKATRVSTFLFLATLFSVAAHAAVPDWLHTLAQQPAKKYADDTNAVTLLDDQETTVKDNGEMVTHQRLVYKILRPEGKEYADFELPYDGETKVNYLHGWSITAKGQEYESKDKDILEHSLSSIIEFNDIKEKILRVSGADVGTIVGIEYEQKRRPFVFQDFWSFQDMIPVEKSRYTLRLPRNWEYRADWVNHAEQKPVEQGSTYVWEVSDVPRIEHEYREPIVRSLAGHMIITLFSDKATHRNAESWKELGDWYAQFTVGAREPSPALQAKVQELAPASLPMFERIRALSLFAQRDVRYYAVEIGIGGFKPHPAGEIFSHRYGDCKDKATVLSSMLALIGVKSYYMLIDDKRGLFNEKTPPHVGFDHMILVIQMPEASFSQKLPGMFEHPKLGHLLIFDPTNDLVPLGHLPYYEQDSFGLLLTDSGGELVHLPVSLPDSNKIHRTAKLKLLPDGTLQGEMEEVRSGYMAMLGRAYLQHQSQNDRKKTLEHFWGPNLGSFQVDSFDLANENDIDKDLVIHYKFTASHYAKTAGQLLLVRPRVIGEMAGAFDVSKPRHYAYEFDAPFLRSDSVEITLPEGYSVDELPDSAKAVFPFAEYTSKAEKDGNVLKYSREYKMQATQVPLDRIEQLKKLFAQIGMDEKNMAVLKKGN